MKRNITLLLTVAAIAALVLSGCAGSSAGGDKSWDKVKQKGEFILGLDDSFPPMGW